MERTEKQIRKQHAALVDSGITVLAILELFEKEDKLDMWQRAALADFRTAMRKAS